MNALADADYSVRHRATRILTDGCLEQAALTLHAGAIVGLLSHPVPNVRSVAMKTLRQLDQAALTPLAGAIVGLLADPDVRCEATLTIRYLDQATLTRHAGARRALGRRALSGNSGWAWRTLS